MRVLITGAIIGIGLLADTLEWPAGIERVMAQPLVAAVPETDLPLPHVVREASRIGAPPPRDTAVALQGSTNKGGQLAVHAARMWLMEQGLRVVESRGDALQIVIVEYTHPLSVQIRGIDRESGEVRWAGSAHVEGDLNRAGLSILNELTRQALAEAWGLPE